MTSWRNDISRPDRGQNLPVGRKRKEVDMIFAPGVTGGKWRRFTESLINTIQPPQSGADRDTEEPAWT